MRTQLFSKKNSIKSNIQNDAFLQKQINAVKLDADELMKETAKSLPYTAFRTFYITGSRKEYEYEYFYHRRRLNDFAALTIVYEDSDEYIRCLQDAIWAVLDEFTWALPAHIPENTKIEKCPEQVDLFAAETAFTLCEIYAIFDGRLDKTIRDRIEYEVRRRVIVPYLSGRENSWDYLENNWSAVCAGSVGAAFLYLAEEREIEAVLPRIKNTLGCYLNGFGSDGVCVEGLNYWTYGFGYFTYFAQLLSEYNGDNLFDNEKVKNIALFPQKICFKNNRTVNFSDCGSEFTHRRGLMYFLNSKYDEVIIPDDTSALDFDGDSCYRFAHLIRDFAWRSNENQTCGGEDYGFEYFENAGWYIKKTRNYEFAIKAGTNNESHNHNDIASFLLNSGGHSVIADSGRGEYTAGYFSDRRYGYFAPSALAHSVPIINGNVQQTGENHFGKISAADKERVAVGFEKAYDDATLKKLGRNFEFGEDKIVMTDIFEFNQNPESITEHFIFSEKPVLRDDELAAGNVRIRYAEELFDCVISEKVFAADYDKYKTVYIADLNFKNPNRETEIKFEINFMEESSYE